MHIGDIDHLAINGNSFFHKRSPLAKGLFVLLLLFSILISFDWIPLIILYGVIIISFALARISLIKIGHLAIYPVFFSLFFVVLTARQDLGQGMIILLRALGAALSMILLITTTPYIDIFSMLSHIMPKLIIDILLMTYRSFFVLSDRMSHLLRTIKLKGGNQPGNYLFNFKTIASTLGTLLIQSFEMSERMYRIYELRGYNGAIPIDNKLKLENAMDIGMAVFGLIMAITMGVLWIR